jgi:Arm DNA-binding domain
MKGRGPHPREALSQALVEVISWPGFYADGGSLYLRVDGAGAKRWILRTTIQGKRRDMGLGSLTFISLAEARQRARTDRAMARAGEDPIALRRKQRA